MSKNDNLLVIGIVTTIIIILLIIIFVYIVLSKKLEYVLFQPELMHSDIDINLHNFIYNNKDCITYHSKVSNDNDTVIIYLHGRYGNLSYYTKLLNYIHSFNVDVYSLDYRGYGRSTGTPNLNNIIEDSKILVDIIKSNKKYNRVIIWGESLGSYPATQIAVEYNYDLILYGAFSTFTEAIRMNHEQGLFISSLLNIYSKHTPNNSSISNLHSNLLIIHSKYDELINPYCAQLNYDRAMNTKDKQLVYIGGTHAIPIFTSEALYTLFNFIGVDEDIYKDVNVKVLNDIIKEITQ